jgi:hypothetical protein
LIGLLAASCGGEEPPPAAPIPAPPAVDVSKDVEEWVRRVAEDEDLGLHRTVVHARAPFVVFVEHAPVSEDLPSAEDLSGELADQLAAFYERVHSLLGEPLDLQRIEEQESLEARWLRVFVYRAPGERSVALSGSRSYYFRKSRWLLHDDRRFPFRRDPPSERLGLLELHEVVHQLFHAYRRIEDPRFEVGSLWFEEGIAELLSSTGVREEGEWGPTPNRLRLEEWKMVRKHRLAEWPLEALLGVRNRVELHRKGVEVGGLTSAHLGSLFHGQAWAFVHFLWFGEGGKHREKLLRYAREEIRGRPGPDAFARIFFGEGPADWSAVEAAWQRHVRSLWKELGIE